MNLAKANKSKITLLIPLLLLLLLSFSAIYVILMGANVYKGIVSDSALNDSARISASYLEEQIHQNDTEEADIRLGKVDGLDALIIEKPINGKRYTSYTFCDNGSLQEALASPGVEIDRTMGSKVTSLKELKLAKLNSNQIQITCLDLNGNKAELIVTTRSN